MPSDEQVLIHIRDNIIAARQFVDGLSFDRFCASHLHVYAATRALEIVSEASRRLSAEFRNEHPELPWKRIMGIGNVLRHDYDNVVESMIWETVQVHLNPLLALVEGELGIAGQRP